MAHHHPGKLGCQHPFGYTLMGKSSLVSNLSLFAAPSLVHVRSRRQRRQCHVCVDSWSVGSLVKVRVDMKASRGNFWGASTSSPFRFSFFQSSQKYSKLPGISAESGNEGASEVALGELTKNENTIPDEAELSKNQQDEDSLSRSGQATDSETPTQIRASSGSSVFSMDGEGGMECIGTGSDVECVVLLKDMDSKVSGKFAGRAVNENSDRVKEEEDKGDGAATLLDSVLGALLLISPFFFWGTSMVAMKGLLPKAGPLFVASTRLIPAGALLVGFASSRGRKMPAGAPAWLAIALFGLIDASCFQLYDQYLEEERDSWQKGCVEQVLALAVLVLFSISTYFIVVDGPGMVIIDSQPLTVAILAALLFGESLGPVAIAGLGLGVVGLIMLEVPLEVLQSAILPEHVQGLVSSNQTESRDWSLWDSGEWWMLLAAQSMAIGTVIVRWVSQLSDPIMATGWHMILGGIPLLALSVWQHDPAVSGHLQDLNASDWGALFYTSLFGSAISYGVFFYNATRGSLTKLSSLTFLTPMFATLFGYLLLDETLNGVQLVGAGVTLLAIYMVNMKVEQATQDSE